MVILSKYYFLFTRQHLKCLSWSRQYSFFAFCPFLGIAQLTLGMNVSFFLCAAFIGRCNKVCGSISSSPSPFLSPCLSLSLVSSVVVLTVMVALVSHWHAPIAPMSVTFICPLNNTLIL